MADVFFTADTHFGHRRMAEQWRGCGSVEEMDETLIAAWNARVKPGDRIYHLGDFSFAGRRTTNEIISRLAGELHVIRGNHDGGLDKFAARFASYRAYHELRMGPQRVVLFHFPIESWHRVGHGSWHLHGHCHNNLPRTPGMGRMDVGVDTRPDLAPWAWEEIVEELSGSHWVPNDHHQT